MRAPHRGRGFGTLRDQRWRSAHRPFDDASPHSTTHMSPFHTAKRPLQIAPRDRCRTPLGVPGGDFSRPNWTMSTLFPVVAAGLVQSATILQQPRQTASLGDWASQTTSWHSAHTLHSVCRVPGSYRTAYEAAASSAGAPMMLRNLSSSRESNRETCIWLMPSSWAISDCERCSK